MRIRGPLLAVLLASATAQANPHLELSGFFGAEQFGNQIDLGDSKFAEQRPQTSPILGFRLSAWLVHGPDADLGLEPELSFMPAWTAYGFDGPRQSYFAPVFGYGGNLILRVHRLRWFQPHALVGGRAQTVVSSSPYLTTDTDPTVYYGVGATIPVGSGWLLRVDARQGWAPANDGSSKATYEGLVAIGHSFERHHRPHHHRIAVAPLPVVVVKPPEPIQTLPPMDPDRDGDGIVDRLDACPDQAEDFDHFEDEDGCPDLDNDHDGLADAMDKCPNEPETFNGFEDDDGCPDSIPPAVSAAFAAASAVKFEPQRARLTEAAKLSLAKALAQFRAHPTMHVVVTGHPDGKGDAVKGEALAKKRAEVVKWYLVEQGVPADQLETKTGEVGKLAIELATAPPIAH